MNLVLFPNNLYEIQYLPPKKDIQDIFLIEEPTFFGHRENIMNFNKLKLILHRSSMKYYQSYLKKKKYKVQYMEYKKIIKSKYNFLKKINVTVYELNDNFLQKKLSKITSLTYLDNPNFLMPPKLLENYYLLTQKKNKVSFKSFFNYVKKEIMEEKDQIKFEKSFDKVNRKKIPNGTQVPPKPIINKKTSKLILKAKLYVQELFPSNPGNEKNFVYPITHIEAKKMLKNFINQKLKYFGTYQDAITSDNVFLFHSILSSSLNIGILSPKYVIKKILELEIENYGINNIEAFLRQIIGWREYQRYCYIYYYEKMKNTNYFGHSKKLSLKWYKGTTGIPPVDNAIRFAFEYGYLHHIVRLMIMANFMNLCRIDPHECYKWFMEFSIDSYDWVMIQNLYSMGLYSDGGLTSRKPYLSSSSYILNLSNYRRGEKWGNIWKALFYTFLEQNETKLKKTTYMRNLNYFKNLNYKNQKKMTKLTLQFLKQI